jgi:hypothetical protein
MLSNIALSLVLILILIVAGYLIAAFFDLEIQFYMPYLLWLLGLCTFNMFLDKSHVNIYTKKTKTMDEENRRPASATTTATETTTATATSSSTATAIGI